MSRALRWWCAALLAGALGGPGTAAAAEPDDTPETATVVDAAGDVRTVIEGAADQDWLVFAVRSLYSVSVAPEVAGCVIDVEERLGPAGPVTQPPRQASGTAPAIWSGGSSHPTRVYVRVGPAGAGCDGASVLLRLSPPESFIPPASVGAASCRPQARAVKRARRAHRRAVRGERRKQVARRKRALVRAKRRHAACRLPA